MTNIKPLKEGKKHHVYIAAPFFNPDQITRVQAIEYLLEKHGFTYFSPRKEVVCPPTATNEQRREAFLSNDRGIREAEFLIAITDDKDVGTMWEMGLAYAVETPVVGVALTLGNAPFNLMLAESCETTCRTLDEVEQYLTSGKKNYYQGEIE